MHPLSTFFSEFSLSCAKLYNALIPWSLAVLVLAFAFEFYHGMELRRCLMFLVKLFVIVLLTSKSHELLNASQSVVEQFLSHTGLVRPESVAQTYKDRLAAALGQPDIKDDSVFWMIFTGHFLDAIIYSLLLAASYVSLFIVTIITYVQKIALLLCWSVVPILFACLAVEPLAHLGRAHVMRILAICCWPIGFAIAATFTDALINMALQEWVLSQDSQVQTVAAAVEDLVILAAVGIWDVISTLAAPAFIHRFLVGHGGPLRLAPEWLSRTASYMATGAAVSVVNSAIQHVWKKSEHGSGEKGGASGSQTRPEQPNLPPPANTTTGPSNSSANSTHHASPHNDPTWARELENLIKTL